MRDTQQSAVTRHQVDTDGWEATTSPSGHWVLSLLSILIVSCGASPDLDLGVVTMLAGGGVWSSDSVSRERECESGEW